MRGDVGLLHYFDGALMHYFDGALVLGRRGRWWRLLLGDELVHLGLEVANFTLERGNLCVARVIVAWLLDVQGLANHALFIVRKRRLGKRGLDGVGVGGHAHD